MGILRIGVLLLIASAGCYSPELRDCTLTCSEASDCAGGQVCGSDHLCAAPDIAGKCSSLPSDAGSNARDAGVDAVMLPDAATHGELAVVIEGEGRITVTGFGTCDKAAPQNGACTYIVPLNASLTVTADSHPNWYFDKWTTAACATTPVATCTFTFSAATPLGAKFKKDS
jgi:hypothetical protein